MIPLFITSLMLTYLVLERILFFYRLKIGGAKASDKELARHLGAIASLTAVAPLLGLLGTVSGMIETFEVISGAGGGDIASLSSGISKALITTEAGLIIAIPGLFAAIRFKTPAHRAKKTEYKTS
ncbi:MAG: hypothetical protein Kow0090_10280 [Myxococcota bacterium]